MHHAHRQVVAATALERTCLQVCGVARLQVHGGHLGGLRLPVARVHVVVDLGNLLGRGRITRRRDQEDAVVVARHAEDVVAGDRRGERAAHALHILVACLGVAGALVVELRAVRLGGPDGIVRQLCGGEALPVLPHLALPRGLGRALLGSCRKRPIVGRELRCQRRERRLRFRDRQVVDGTCRLGGDAHVGVVQEARHLRVAGHAHGKHGHHARLRERVRGELTHLVGLLHADQAHHRRVAEEGILVVVLPGHGADVLDGRQELDLAEGDRRLRAHARVLVGEERDESRAGGFDPRIAREARRQAAHLDVLVGQMRHNGVIGLGEPLARIRCAPRLHAERPECMEARLDRLPGIGGGLCKQVGDLRAAARQFQVRALADAHVGVRHALEEERVRLLGEAVAHQVLRGADVHVLNLGGIPQREDLPGAVAFPAVRPVADVHPAVPAEVDVGGKHFLHELVRIGHLVAGALGLDGEGEDLAVLVATEEVAEEEVVLVSVRKSEARIEGHACGAVGEVLDGWQVPRRAHGVGGVPLPPAALLVPRSALVAAFERLVVHVPARLAAFHDVDDARAVAAVGVVVAGEEVAPLVEGQFLRIPQRMREDLQARAVRLAAEDGTREDALEVLPLLVGDVVAAVADRPVDAAVGPGGQAVHVVPAQRGAHAEAGEHLLAHVGDAGARGVLEAPQVRDARVPDRTIEIHHARARAVERLIDGAAEGRHLVRHAVTVRVDEVRDPVLLLAVVVHATGALGRPLLVHLQAVLHRLQLEVVLEPELGGAVVLDTLLLAERFGDVDRAVVGDAEGDGVLHQRLLGDERPGEAGDRGDGGCGGRSRGSGRPCFGSGCGWRLGNEGRGEEREGVEEGHVWQEA